MYAALFPINSKIWNLNESNTESSAQSSEGRSQFEQVRTTSSTSHFEFRPHNFISQTTVFLINWFSRHKCRKLWTKHLLSQHNITLWQLIPWTILNLRAEFTRLHSLIIHRHMVWLVSGCPWTRSKMRGTSLILVPFILVPLIQVPFILVPSVLVLELFHSS